MSDALFPKLKGLSWSVLMTPMWSTIIQEAVSGDETRIALFDQPRLLFTLTYEYLSNKAVDNTGYYSGYSPLKQLEGFYMLRKGDFDSFLLNMSDLTRDPNDSTTTNTSMTNMTTLAANGDGSTRNFQLSIDLGLGFLYWIKNPNTTTNTHPLNVYVNNVLKSTPADYTISSGLVTFGSAPGNNVSVTASFDYFLRCTFDLSNGGTTGRSKAIGVDFENFMYQLWTMKSISLLTVKK